MEIFDFSIFKTFPIPASTRAGYWFTILEYSRGGRKPIIRPVREKRPHRIRFTLARRGSRMLSEECGTTAGFQKS